MLKNKLLIFILIALILGAIIGSIINLSVESDLSKISLTKAQFLQKFSDKKYGAKKYIIYNENHKN